MSYRPRITRWDHTVPCIRPNATDDDVCTGTVRVHGYDDPGRNYGANNDDAYPPEGESLADACSVCGYDEWTDDDIEELRGEGGRSSGSESHDDYGERGEPEYWEDR